MNATQERAVAELLAPELSQLLAEGRADDARQTLEELLDPELVDLLPMLAEAHREQAVELLPLPRAAKLFARLDPETRNRLLDALDSARLAEIFNEMPPDDRTELFEDMPSGFAARVLALMKPEERRLTQVTLGYPEQSVGRLMTSDFLAIRGEWAVGQAMVHVRRHGRDAETIDTLYVVDNKGRLLDEVGIRQLILAEPLAPISSLIDGKVVALKASDDREEAVRAMDRYDHPVLPVIDDAGLLLGIITFDDVADVAKEETTEDIQKMGGLEALDEPYMTMPLHRLIRKRGGWLSALFLGEMLTATAMGHFNSEIEHAAKLAIFLPLIISSGGNSGGQAATLVIRAMATREIRLRDWWRVFRRELACGLFLGLLLGLIGLLRINLWQWFGLFNYNPQYELIALTVAISLIGVVLWGTLMGGMLPLALRAMKLDPAAISAPFIATLVDVSGLTIYFTIAMIILKGTLL